jgi:hypothetical protein
LEPTQQSTATGGPRKKGSRTMTIVSLIASIMLFSTFVVFTVIPIVRWGASRSYQETVCTILSSSMERQPSKDRPKWRIDVTYVYHFAGRQWKGAKYDLEVQSRGKFDEVREILARLPPGARVPCYVNPKDPASAYIVRSLRLSSVIIGVVVGIGLGLLFFYLFLAGLREW